MKEEILEKKSSLYRVFKNQIENIADKKSLIWLHRRHPKKEMESFIIAAQKNCIRTSHIKGITDKTYKTLNTDFSKKEMKQQTI